jgi:hypothetical protein
VPGLAGEAVEWWVAGEQWSGGRLPEIPQGSHLCRSIGYVTPYLSWRFFAGRPPENMRQGMRRATPGHVTITFTRHLSDVVDSSLIDPFMAVDVALCTP